MEYMDYRKCPQGCGLIPVTHKRVDREVVTAKDRNIVRQQPSTVESINADLLAACEAAKELRSIESRMYTLDQQAQQGALSGSRRREWNELTAKKSAIYEQIEAAFAKAKGANHV